MLNKYNITVLLILIISLIIVEFNTEYKLINNDIYFNIEKNKNIGTLYVGTHNYEHKDIFITMKHFSKYSNNKFYMLFANKSWNYLLEPFRPKNVEFLYVKEKTVERISTKLLNGYNVIMFLYKESDSSGPYYILKNTLSPLVIFKIKSENTNDTIVNNHYNSSFKDIFLSNFMKKYILEFKNINYKLLNNNGHKIFMERLKLKMY